MAEFIIPFLYLMHLYHSTQNSSALFVLLKARFNLFDVGFKTEKWLRTTTKSIDKNTRDVLRNNV